MNFTLKGYADLNDHWTARSHKKERNNFIQQLQNLAMLKRLRITFLSGDVHCAAVGLLKTLSHGGRRVDPKLDHRDMLNVVSSAIVNTPCVSVALVTRFLTNTFQTSGGCTEDGLCTQ